MALNYLYQCEVCAIGCTCAYRLANGHRALIEKVYRLLRIHITANNSPHVACQHCIEKIEAFDGLIALLQKGQEKLCDTNEKMHHDLNDPHREGEDKPELHDYNCQCPECCSRFGSLELLAQVIEQQSQKEQVKTEQNQLVEDLSLPSTSYTSEPGPSSSKQSSKWMNCTYCDKVFTHRGDLNKHIRKHTGEQPFSCRICNRKFTHTSNLTRHLKVHTGDKPYGCNFCGKRFSRKDKLESHKKTKLCKKYSKRTEPS